LLRGFSLLGASEIFRAFDAEYLANVNLVTLGCVAAKGILSDYISSMLG